MSEELIQDPSESNAMTMSTITIVVATLAIIVIAGTGIIIANSGATGPLQIMITDATGDWEHVNVTFSTVEVHDSTDSNTSGWHSLPIVQGTIDLVQANDFAALLASGSISVGNYTQIRLVVISATGVMTDGTQVNFKVPSGELKTTTPFQILDNSTTTLTVDIDLPHSIVHADGQWIFKPVLGEVAQS